MRSYILYTSKLMSTCLWWTGNCAALERQSGNQTRRRTQSPIDTWHDANSRSNIIPRFARIWRRKTDRMTSFR